MSNIKSFCIVLLSVCILSFTSCLFNPTPYPSDYYNYDWKEISFEEARSKWDNYDTSSKLHSRANVFQNYPNRNYLVLNCFVQGDSYEKFELQILIGEVLDVTVSPEKSNVHGDIKYYTCQENTSLVKVVGGHAWWDSRIYESGWMVEARKDTSNDHEYYFIDYLD